ncbi:neocarzinostatin apoprotein domain-containing protein [Actinomadura sp. 9N407]|uniref:neocarzinostatin apoprotein domain-containing protein n=1 Tax=Actinomadura sp. 9N407 TaxID=3375154 RepID=UPI00379DBF6C
MPAIRPVPAWARPLAASLLAAALAPATLATTTASASAAKPELTVTPSGDLAAGTRITVKGTGFEAEKILFVAVCDSKKPLGAACDTGNYAKATTGADGSLSAKLKAVPVYGDTDCTKTSCALMTNDPADPTSTRNFVTVPLTFAGGGGASGAPAVAASPPAQAVPAAKKDEGSGTTLLVGGAIAVLVVAGVVILLIRRGRSAPGKP